MCDDCEALRQQLLAANNVLRHAFEHFEDGAWGMARAQVQSELRGYFNVRPEAAADTDACGIRTYGAEGWAAKRGSDPTQTCAGIGGE